VHGEFFECNIDVRRVISKSLEMLNLGVLVVVNMALALPL
jgi:hypothetical protein